MTNTFPAFREDPTLRVGLAQFKPEKADVSSNLERIGSIIEEHNSETDLLIFPETALSGYFLEGGVQEVALKASEVARHLGAPPEDGPDVIVGFYER